MCVCVCVCGHVGGGRQDRGGGPQGHKDGVLPIFFSILCSNVLDPV